MKLRFAVPIGAVVMIVAIGLSQPRAQKGPVFKQDGSLVLPSWFSGMGLRWRTNYS